MSADELHIGWAVTSTGDWTHARNRLDRLDVCFTDDQGLHITGAYNLPRQAPRACTHVWGWGADRLVHIRLDNTTTYVTELTTTVPDHHNAHQVTFRRESSLAFRTAQGEAASLRLAADTEPTLLGNAATAHVIIDGPRLVFLSA